MPQRVSPVTFPDTYELPAKPDSNQAAVQDAFRQTQFLLGTELKLFAEGAALQLGIVSATSPSKYRTHEMAALLALWSRTFLSLSDALLLVTRGSYASVPPIVRTAAECIAAQEALRAGEMPSYLDWLKDAMTVDEEQKAIDLGLGRYFAGETLASNPRLRAVYRPASDLGRPNFGATLLMVGAESNRTRVLVSFADQAFHYGWAQITFGWLLQLSSVQLGVALHAGAVFVADERTRVAVHRWNQQVEALLAAPERCRIRESEADPHRYVVENFRRTSGGAARRFVL